MENISEFHSSAFSCFSHCKYSLINFKCDPIKVYSKCQIADEDSFGYRLYKIRCHLTSTKMALIRKKKTENTSVEKDVENENPHILFVIT